MIPKNNKFIIEIILLIVTVRNDVGSYCGLRTRCILHRAFLQDFNLEPWSCNCIPIQSLIPQGLGLGSCRYIIYTTTIIYHTILKPIIYQLYYNLGTNSARVWCSPASRCSAPWASKSMHQSSRGPWGHTGVADHEIMLGAQKTT